MGKVRRQFVLLSPLLAYFLFFFFVPMIVLFVYSFWKTTTTGLVPAFTLKNYANIFSRALYPVVIARSIQIGFVTAVLCVLVSYPVAFSLTASGTTR